MSRATFLKALCASLLLLPGCSGDKSTSSDAKDYQSCSAIDNNGQCTKVENGRESKFSTSASQPCTCNVGSSANAFSDSSNAGSGTPGTQPQGFGSPNSQSYDDFAKRSIQDQINQIQSMNMPADVKQQMIANLQQMLDFGQGGNWSQPPQMGQDPAWGSNFQWNDSCSANYVNGQCQVTKNGQPINTWANSMAQCQQQCNS